MVPLRKYSRVQISRGVRLVSEGLSYAAAARETQMSVPALRHHCVSAGVISTARNGHRTAFAPGARAFSADEDARLIEMKAFGSPLSHIGRHLGRSVSSVRSRLATLQLNKLRDGEEV